MEYAQAKRTLELRVLVAQQRQAEFVRTSGLLERGMVSRAGYDKAVEASDRANLERQMASEELALLEDGRAEVAGRVVESIIVSPISGHVLKLNVDVGDPIVPLTSFQPGTELLALADMAELLFEGTVDEIDVGKIREGMPAKIKIGAFPDTVVTGSLSRISLKSEKKDNATVFGVEIAIETVPEGVVLRAGYSANSDIIIRRVEEVLVLPERVLLFRGDTTLVRLPSPDGEDSKPEEVPIEIGMSDGISVELVAGLELGDIVLDKEIKEIK